MSNSRKSHERARQISDLYNEMKVAGGEQLCGGRRLVLGEGNPAADLALVGEAPGGQEERRGRPFVGPAGQVLDEALAAAGLQRDALWITNIVKCRPTTEGLGGRLRNRTPASDEIQWFLPWVLRELEIVAPRVIVCLGATAANALLGTTVRITRQRGQWFKGPHGIDTIVTYHPAYLLRRSSDREERYVEFVHDLRSAAVRLQTLSGQS